MLSILNLDLNQNENSFGYEKTVGWSEGSKRKPSKTVGRIFATRTHPTAVGDGATVDRDVRYHRALHAHDQRAARVLPRDAFEPDVGGAVLQHDEVAGG